jgi:hypothetical protein
MNSKRQQPTLWQHAMSVGLRDFEMRLAQLNWSHPLTRADLRDLWYDLPRDVYLRLPAAKRFMSASEVVRALLQAELQETDDLPEEFLVATYGGPPAWGSDPLIAGAIQNSGSGTDTGHGW